jgi:hypothetical protein
MKIRHLSEQIGVLVVRPVSSRQREFLKGLTLSSSFQMPVTTAPQ